MSTQPSGNNSLRGHLIALLAAMGIFLGLVLFAAVSAHGYFLAISSRDGLTAQLKNSLPKQIDTLLTVLLLPEQRKGLPLVLKKIEEEDGLTSATLLLGAMKLPGYSGCQFYERTSTCISDDGLSLGVVTPIRDQTTELGFLFKAKSIPRFTNYRSLLYITCLLLILAIPVGIATLKIVRVANRNALDYIDALMEWVDKSFSEKVPPSDPPPSQYAELDYFRNKLVTIIRKQKSIELDNTRLQHEAAIGEIAAKVAHDIKSPLLSLEMLFATIKVEENQHHRLNESLRRIREIADELLEKYRSRRRFKNLSSHSFGELLKTVIEHKKVEFHKRATVAFLTEIDPTLDEMNFPFAASELERIVSNLINNSVEAIEKSGVISLTCSNMGDYVVLTITDNGKGISENLLARLGDAVLTADKTGGTGLGIFHAKRTIEQWNGKFHITSDEKMGTVVRLEIPVKDSFARTV